MSVDCAALDDAYDRLASSGFVLPNGFVHHGPMVCEALAALDCDGEIDGWARRAAHWGGTAVEPIRSSRFEWTEALGDYQRLPEWIGYFDGAVATHGWAAVVGEWVPRLMPALSIALFHGAIRTAHAVRAVAAVDTEARRGELARALGFWAARWQLGEEVKEIDRFEAPSLEIARAAANGARFYLSEPNIFYLHGVTGAMAVHLMAEHLSAEGQAAALAHVMAEHAAVYGGVEPTLDSKILPIEGAVLAATAARSGDPHEVKLVEACRRGQAATGDEVFAAAAQLVTGLAP